MQTLRVCSNPFDKIVQSLVALSPFFGGKATTSWYMQLVIRRSWQWVRKPSFDAAIHLFEHYTGRDLLLERLDSCVLDRILLGT